MHRNLFDFIFILLAAVFVLFLSKKPIYNWDMIAYIGVAIEYSEHDAQKVHDSVYHVLQREVPANVYSVLTNSVDDRRECLLSTKAFEEELSFFRTKPLYTFLVYLLHRAGIPFVAATLVPSVIGCFGIIVLIYFWLCTYVKRPLAFLITALIVLLRVFSELDRYSTPDALSNFFVLLSLYFVATNKRSGWIASSLLLATVCRIDNFLLVIAISYFTYLSKYNNSLLKLAMAALISIVCVIGIPVLLGDSPNWFTKFAFLFSLKDYVQHWRDVIYILRTDVLYVLLIVLTAYLYIKADKKIKLILNIIVSTIIARLFLFPSLQERFFAAYEFAVIILFVSYMVAARKPFIQVRKLNSAA